MVRRLKAPANYATCPLCWATRCDLDFTLTLAIRVRVVCRICGHHRPAQ